MEIVKAALPPQQQREALLLGKYWTPATAFEARVVDQVAPTPQAAVAAACGLVCSLPAQAAFAYSVNKAYLHRPFLADMVGESYDQFVNACYTPEAQVGRPSVAVVAMLLCVCTSRSPKAVILAGPIRGSSATHGAQTWHPTRYLRCCCRRGCKWHTACSAAVHVGGATARGIAECVSLAA